MSYPAILDSFTNPTANQKLNSPSHSGIETAQNTALAALETKLGVDSSAVTTTIDYLLKSTSSIDPGHKHTIASLVGIGQFIVTGIIVPYAGSSSPTGFLLCDGTAYSRSLQSALFSVISTTYGAGDGSTTFNVPDLRSRMVMGVGTGAKVFTWSSRASSVITVTGSENSTTNDVQTGQAVLYVSTGGVMTGLTSNTTYYIVRVAYNQFSLASSLVNAYTNTVVSLSSDGSGIQTFTSTLTARALADTGGEETHALLTAEIQAHVHAQIMSNNAGGTPVLPAQEGNNGQTTGGNTGATGGNTPHNTIPPFLALNYLIKT